MKPTAEQLATRKKEKLRVVMTAAIQKLLDDTARSRGYDHMLSLVSYSASANSTFAAEAAAGMAFRDACWAKGFEILAAVEGGTRPVPTVEQLLAEMPAIGW